MNVLDLRLLPYRHRLALLDIESDRTPGMLPLLAPQSPGGATVPDGSPFDRRRRRDALASTSRNLRWVRTASQLSGLQSPRRPLGSLNANPQRLLVISPVARMAAVNQATHERPIATGDSERFGESPNGMFPAAISMIKPMVGARGAVRSREPRVHTEEVIGSSPVSPTIRLPEPRLSGLSS